MLIRNWTIGGDMELFLQDKETKEIVSAEGIIKGTKDNPYNFDEEDEFACTSLDNVLAEFNIAPVKDAAGYFWGIQKALKYINSMIPENLTTVALPAARLDEKYLQTRHAKLFGCSVDINAWLNVENTPPIADGNLRSAGHHITMGYENPSEMVNLMWVKAQDLHIGIPSVLQEPENERKKLYGKAGAFRHTAFGVEYRSSSNYLLQDKKYIDWAFNNTVEAINFINEDKGYLLDEEADNIISAINDKDKEKAKYLIDKFQIKMAA